MYEYDKRPPGNLLDPSDLTFNTEVRRKFISKVYTILTVQVFCTVLLSLFFVLM
jgi:hypothetical protein